MRRRKHMKKPGIKALGLLATLGGIAMTLLSSFVSERKTDAKIEEKVRKALAEHLGKGE